MLIFGGVSLSRGIGIEISITGLCTLTLLQPFARRLIGKMLILVAHECSSGYDLGEFFHHPPK